MLCFVTTASEAEGCARALAIMLPICLWDHGRGKNIINLTNILALAIVYDN